MTVIPFPERAAVPHRGIVTICSMIATLMQALDNTIANVALPYMQGSLSTTLDQITWVLTSYVVAAAIMTAPVGWLAARFGRKNLFLVCVGGFTVASMLCGIAESLAQMVVFRLLQGMFGAALVPLSQATMLDLYPIQQRGSAMAWWGMGVMVGPILGPTLGGYLTDMYDWRWVFYINLPFGILAMVGLWLFMQDGGQNAKLRFDWTGFAVLSLCLGAFQLMLDRGEQLDWFSSAEIVTELILAVLGLYLFVVHMFTAENPFITPRIFRDINFVSGILVMLVVGTVLLSSSALLAPYLQTLGGYSVSDAGLLMVPRGVGTMFAMMTAGRLTNRVDPRWLMFIGVMLLAVSFWDMSGWTPDVSAWSMSVTTMVQGVGLGFVFVPLQVIAFATLDPELRTEGTALFSLMRNVGGAIGISVTAFLLAQNTQIMHARLAESVTPYNRMLQTGSAYLFWNASRAKGLIGLNDEITRQSQIIAYANDFKLMLLVSIPVALLVFLMRRPRRRPALEAVPVE
ncbi:MAG: DHA2 family efflux MFS transporter permease subunit [Hyphomicrobiales bacterium]|nr:DHA2 family efflux MFS transporter permease subunit [Hyphomicrobiales bacterium]MBV8826021.1 DHA2 family efflux MFS transporter permease subunit [Hyphomicrobiales bacterium]